MSICGEMSGKMNNNSENGKCNTSIDRSEVDVIVLSFRYDIKEYQLFRCQQSVNGIDQLSLKSFS